MSFPFLSMNHNPLVTCCIMLQHMNACYELVTCHKVVVDSMSCLSQCQYKDSQTCSIADFCCMHAVQSVCTGKTWTQIDCTEEFVDTQSVQVSMKQVQYKSVARFAKTCSAGSLLIVIVLQALAVAGILLLLMTKNLAPSNVLGFCVAASNAFGLIAGIFLMGYGLVAIPKELWRTADTKNYRKLLFHRAGVQAEKAMSAHA